MLVRNSNKKNNGNNKFEAYEKKVDEQFGNALYLEQLTKFHQLQYG